MALPDGLRLARAPSRECRTTGFVWPQDSVSRWGRRSPFPPISPDSEGGDALRIGGPFSHSEPSRIRDRTERIPTLNSAL